MSRPFATDRARCALTALVVALAAATLVIALRSAVAQGERLIAADEEITAWFVDHRSSAATTVLRVLTRLGSGPVIVVAATTVAFAVWRRGHRLLAVLPATASSITALVVVLIKVSSERPRPAAIDQITTAPGWAFPSGHSAQAATFYGAAAVVVWAITPNVRARLVAIAAAVLAALVVGISRVYLGVHWGSDVIAGWAVGIACLAVIVTGICIIDVGRSPTAPGRTATPGTHESRVRGSNPPPHDYKSSALPTELTRRGDQSTGRPGDGAFLVRSPNPADGSVRCGSAALARSFR